MNLADLGLPSLVGDLERVEQSLDDSVRNQNAYLGEVASHLLGAGGKRLRPALCLATAYAATGPGPAHADAITGASSVELVHLGSLYHDDVIDEAETRRGVPSVNARWSNIVAILAGDYLLARASSLAASLGADVAALLAATIGELCRGQVLELQHLFDTGRDETTYLSAIEGKTASLFATSCRIGGMVADADAPTLDALSAFGHHLGMCFQIVDDVLDVTASDAELGKPSGNDLIEGVYTLPVIYSLRDSDELRDLIGQPLTPEASERARSVVASNGAVGAALDVARAHAKLADEALAGAAGLDLDVCNSLRRLVDDLLIRTA